MKKRRDYAELLIWAAVLVTVVRYAGAFIASDLGEIGGTVSLVFGWMMGLTGLGMGVLDVLGGAYIFEGWRRALPARGQKWSFRFRVLTVFVGSLFGSGIGILVPYTVSRVSHQTMGAVLGEGWMLWGWALLVNVAPYILIGGVVTGNAGVVGVGGPASAAQVGKLPESGSSVSGRGGKVAGQMRPIWLDWREVPESEYREIAGLKPVKVMQLYGVPERTARNWVARAKAAVGNGSRPLQEELPINLTPDLLRQTQQAFLGMEGENKEARDE